jgi:hypothetical protein
LLGRHLACCCREIPIPNNAHVRPADTSFASGLSGGARLPSTRFWHDDLHATSGQSELTRAHIFRCGCAAPLGRMPVDFFPISSPVFVRIFCNPYSTLRDRLKLNVIPSAVGCDLGHEPSAMSSGTVQAGRQYPWIHLSIITSQTRTVQHRPPEPILPCSLKRNDEFCNRLFFFLAHGDFCSLDASHTWVLGLVLYSLRSWHFVWWRVESIVRDPLLQDFFNTGRTG